MIPFKNPNQAGFTFIEIVVTMGLIGMVLSALFNIHITILQLTMRSTDHMSRLFVLSHEINEIAMRVQEGAVPKSLSAKKQLDEPVMALTTQVGPAHAQSSLRKIRNLMVVSAQGSWERVGRTQQELIMSLQFIPPQLPEKEKS